MNQCACDSEEREHGVGAGVNATMLSETLAVISLAESAARAFRLRKKPMNLCACHSEEREHGDEREDVGMGWVCSREVAGALGTLLTEEGEDGDT